MTFSLVSDIVSRDVDRMLHYALLWGFDSVELRMVGEARVPEVNEEKLLRRLDEAEMSVSAINPGLFESPPEERAAWLNDLAMLPESVRFCERIGCNTIVASAFTASDAPDARAMAVDAMRRAGDVAARRNVVIAVMNEAEGLIASTGDLAGFLDEVGHPAVRGAWSPSEALRGGEESLDEFNGLVGHLTQVRAAQIARTNGDWKPAPFPEGTVDWPSVLRRLRKAGFDGTITMEPRAEPLKKQAVRDATWFLAEWRRARA